MFLLIQQFTMQLPLNRGLVEIDIDPAAERYIVLDRRNMALIYTGFKPESGNARLIVPLQYTLDNNLIVLILDDAGSPSYYVTGNDKVQAALVDARTVTLNP